MKIEHIAIWVRDLEKMKDFYTRFFAMKCNDKYLNEKKQFSSYFLSFEGGARIEIMHRPDISEQAAKAGTIFGLTHFAISVGSRERVDELTESIRSAGYEITGEPRTTGDGYYESVITDPEGNLVEITD
ncbi:MAG: glyoxalase/bleomycin resistance/extradiol dioxygenase family protein [Bacteroidetes bacterium]|nr:MAG: glyoxalase/bleomycin resistance/extradiol dioxygenase family protein [Bacteroidota bacterium]RLD65905.1 MAG: glyoxalase/bleomycin resistance/extradiol dioxygenase family protein [Bacteroidota bacterium]